MNTFTMSDEEKIPFSSNGKQKNPQDSRKGGASESEQPQYRSQIDPGRISQKKQIRSQIPRFRSQIPRNQDSETENPGDDSNS